MSFSKDFVWGAASASYQIEGGAFEDGRGLSIWDTFSHTPGKTWNGHTGDVACDAYHRLEEDLDLMVSLGIKNYRFSISWPRILPSGRLPVNEKGLSYYDRLVDGCLQRGITPWMTLYHWDLPLELYYQGGWLNRATAETFGEFAALIAEHFKGRVTNYITLNEPQCAIGLGHGNGAHAPGTLLCDEEMFRSWHHLLMAHGFAARAIREADPAASVGAASTGNLTYLADRRSETPPALANAAFLSSSKADNPGWYFNHQWFLDPVCLGHYPDDAKAAWMPFAQKISPEDMDIIFQKPDFIGLNIYNGHEMTFTDDGSLIQAPKYPGYPRTALKWPVTPEVLYWGPRLIFERYGLPMIISENGQSCNDKIFLDGNVHDPDRIDFLTRYLRELKAACEDQIPVIGYFHWSLTDNFEWMSGYDDRFGLIYIDYRNQKRIPKDSAFWYRDVIADNGENL